MRNFKEPCDNKTADPTLKYIIIIIDFLYGLTTNSIYLILQSILNFINLIKHNKYMKLLEDISYIIYKLWLFSNV
jgi:hypothetical protein